MTGKADVYVGSNVVTYGWEEAQSKDAQQTGFSASTVADDDEFPESHGGLASADWRGNELSVCLFWRLVQHSGGKVLWCSKSVTRRALDRTDSVP